VRELSSPRVDQSARCPVRELAIRELAYPRVVQLPLRRLVEVVDNDWAYADMHISTLV